MATTQVVETPPVIEWSRWYNRFRVQWNQGDHLLFAGPTQSGKSLLARQIVLLRKYVVVLGTKPNDKTLDGYLNDGFVRIDHWPPVDRDFKKQEPGCARFILWPKIVTIDDLQKPEVRGLFQKALKSIYVEGKWTVVVDETLWFCDRGGLNLGQLLGSMAYGVASNKVSMLFLMQRPAGVPRILWQSCTTALLFHLGVTTDVRELASLGTQRPKDVVEAIQNLQGHHFLELPLRGGAKWSESEVDPALAR